MFSPVITLQGVSFQYPASDNYLIRSLTISLGPERIGLVGDNGMGKSTLLKLITRELAPTHGKISQQGTIARLSQRFEGKQEYSASTLLGIEPMLNAFARLEKGQATPEDLLTIGDDWGFLDRLDKNLATVALTRTHLERAFATLSGGEQTKVRLLACLQEKPDFLLLDEPTNNLDKQSREFLYAFVETWEQGMIVAAHDRSLLSRMDSIIQLTSAGHEHYGGNYAHFVEQSAIRTVAADHWAQATADRLEKKQTQLKKRMEQNTKGKVKGVREKKAKIQAKGSYDKLLLKSKKGRSERTQGRLKKQNERKMEGLQDQVVEAKAKLPEVAELKFKLMGKSRSNRKVLVHLQKVSFAYPNQPNLLENMDFSMLGGERVWIQGNNGVGKSTLLKLIAGELPVSTGEISRPNLDTIAYLDQHCSGLNNEQTVLDNFRRYHPQCPLTKAHLHLADFEFPAKKSSQQVATLSGGERLRAMMACFIGPSAQPSLLLLDEPTNHLDLNSVHYLEALLNKYQGAFLVVSHDEAFCQAIGVTQSLALG